MNEDRVFVLLSLCFFLVCKIRTSGLASLTFHFLNVYLKNNNIVILPKSIGIRY